VLDDDDNDEKPLKEKKKKDKKRKWFWRRQKKNKVSAEQVQTISCAEKIQDCADQTTNCADQISICAELSHDSAETSDCTELIPDCAEESSDCADQISICAELSHDSAKTTNCTELIPDCTEESSDSAVQTIVSAEKITDSSAQPVDCVEKTSVPHSAEQALTLFGDCAEQLALAIVSTQTMPGLPAIAINCTDTEETGAASASLQENTALSILSSLIPTPTPTLSPPLLSSPPSFPSLVERSSEGPVMEPFYDPIKSLKKYRPEEPVCVKRDHTVLGFPNMGNTCYMNATLQSLLSLPTFVSDIRREESCWRPNLTTHLLKYLVDLHTARSNNNERRKKDLLKMVKHSVSETFFDSSGSEQQDVHEFLMALIYVQCKEEGAGPEAQRRSLPSTAQSRPTLTLSWSPSGQCNSPVSWRFGASTAADSRPRWYRSSNHCPESCCSKLNVLVIMSAAGNWNWQDLSSSLSQRAQIHKPSGSSDETSRHQGGDVPSTAEKNLRPEEQNAASEIVQDSYIASDPSARSQYKISSVVSHIGSSINHGHYVSDSLDGSDRWLSFDDDIVQERAQEKVLQKRGDRAYLLFYEH
ncbi:hypothetical protein JZ751_004710, partial [Albula glossodonta]